VHFYRATGQTSSCTGPHAASAFRVTSRGAAFFFARHPMIAEKGAPAARFSWEEPTAACALAAESINSRVRAMLMKGTR
jgi:hypothetical protein